MSSRSSSFVALLFIASFVVLSQQSTGEFLATESPENLGQSYIPWVTKSTERLGLPDGVVVNAIAFDGDEDYPHAYSGVGVLIGSDYKIYTSAANSSSSAGAFPTFTEAGKVPDVDRPYRYICQSVVIHNGYFTVGCVYVTNKDYFRDVNVLLYTYSLSHPGDLIATEKDYYRGASEYDFVEVAYGQKGNIADYMFSILNIDYVDIFKITNVKNIKSFL